MTLAQPPADYSAASAIPRASNPRSSGLHDPKLVPACKAAPIASTLTKHLGLLFVPAAVGVVMFWPQLKTHFWAIAVALTVSVTATIAVSAAVLRYWPGRKSES